jgi:glycosyltransferase involved in cell wall biosynthesis
MAHTGVHRDEVDRSQRAPKNGITRTWPSVSIVIPVYNRAAKVLETLDSVVSQTRPPAELVIVDDGSTDGTADAVAAWKSRVGPPFEILIVRTRNQGAGAARNTGLRETSGEFVAFLDSDDTWPSDLLERAAPLLAADPYAVAAVCDRRVLMDAEVADLSTVGLTSDPLAWLFQHDAGIGSCTLFRTSVIDACGGYDARLPTGQDADLFVRVSLLGDWLHVPGNPAIICQIIGPQRLGERNLSKSLGNNAEQWAGIYEALYELLLAIPISAVRARTLRPLVAARWHRAAQKLRTAGAEPERVVACYRRSLYWNLVDLRTWRRFAWSAAQAIGAPRGQCWSPPPLRPLPSLSGVSRAV